MKWWECFWAPHLLLYLVVLNVVVFERGMPGGGVCIGGFVWGWWGIVVVVWGIWCSVVGGKMVVVWRFVLFIILD